MHNWQKKGKDNCLGISGKYISMFVGYNGIETVNFMGTQSLIMCYFTVLNTIPNNEANTLMLFGA